MLSTLPQHRPLQTSSIANPTSNKNVIANPTDTNDVSHRNRDSNIHILHPITVSALSSKTLVLASASAKVYHANFTGAGSGLKEKDWKYFNQRGKVVFGRDSEVAGEGVADEDGEVYEEEEAQGHGQELITEHEHGHQHQQDVQPKRVKETSYPTPRGSTDSDNDDRVTASDNDSGYEPEVTRSARETESNGRSKSPSPSRVQEKGTRRVNENRTIPGMKKQVATKFWFRLLDQETGQVIWLFQIPDSLEYNMDKPFFHAFHGRSRMWGFVFDDDDEGLVFGKVVQSYMGVPPERSGSTSKARSRAIPASVKKTRSTRSTKSTTNKGLPLPLPSFLKSTASASNPALVPGNGAPSKVSAASSLRVTQPTASTSSLDLRRIMSTLPPSAASNTVKPLKARNLRPKISHSMISLPEVSSFVHVSHIGFNKDGCFEWTEGIDPKWTQVLGELQNKGTHNGGRGNFAAEDTGTPRLGGGMTLKRFVGPVAIRSGCTGCV